jgi:hypothetical protein
MTRRLLSLAALMVLLLNVSGVAMLAHERSAHHGEFAGHDDAHCVVCQAIAAARTGAPPPTLLGVVTTTPTPRWTTPVEAPTPHALDLPTNLTARGPPAA